MPNAAIAGRVVIVPTAADLAPRVAAWIADVCAAALLAGDDRPIRIALSGGETPRGLYALLGSPEYHARLPWARVHLYWGDERFVPHDDPRSNTRLVRETLLAHAPVPPDHIHPIGDSGDADAAARAYEAVLKRAYGADTLDPARPLFDVNLLGLGGDGHTASLIPGQPVLRERSRWVAAVPRGRDEARITLTYPALESSRACAMLVAGRDKAEAVRRVRAGDVTLPAGALAPQGDVIWFLDAAAAGGTA